MALIPKLAVPLQLGRHGFATVEQDSQDEITACAYAVVATPRGSRLEQPDFGVVDPSFEQLPLDLSEWLAQLGIWEPRAHVQTAQEIEELADVITVGVEAPA